MCAVAVPIGTAGPAQFGITVRARAFDDAVDLDVAALASGQQAPVDVWPLGPGDAGELVTASPPPAAPPGHQLIDLSDVEVTTSASRSPDLHVA